jgi:hypothetical protein
MIRRGRRSTVIRPSRAAMRRVNCASFRQTPARAISLRLRSHVPCVRQPDRPSARCNARHIPEDIRDGAAILARLGHQRSKCLSNVRGIAATVRKRLDVALAPYTSLIARAWIDALPSICGIAGSANHGKIASISCETGSLVPAICAPRKRSISKRSFGIFRIEKMSEEGRFAGSSRTIIAGNKSIGMSESPATI